MYCYYDYSFYSMSFIALHISVVQKFTFFRSACKFVLVEFTEEKEIEVVPYIWLKEGEKTCRWPPFRSSQKIQVAVKQCIFPSSDFKELPVKVLYRTGWFLTLFLKIKLFFSVSTM